MSLLCKNSVGILSLYSFQLNDFFSKSSNGLNLRLKNSCFGPLDLVREIISHPNILYIAMISMSGLLSIYKIDESDRLTLCFELPYDVRIKKGCFIWNSTG